MATYKEVFLLLQDIGITDVILPFFFVTTLFYGVLLKTKIFEHTENKKVVNMTISLVAGLLFVVSGSRVEVLNVVLQRIALAVLAAILLQLLIGLVSKEHALTKSRYFFPVVLIIVLAIFIGALGWDYRQILKELASILINPVVIMFIVFIAVAYYITHEKEDGKSSEGKSEEKKVPGSRSVSSAPDYSLRYSPEMKNIGYRDMTEQAKVKK